MSDEMRILTLWQPWATLIALGLKQYETRSFSTRYRGAIAIHAAKRPVVYEEKQAIVDALRGRGCSENYTKMVSLFGRYDFPLGCIVAIADLSDCLPMSNQYSEPGQVNHFEKGLFDSARWHVLIHAMTPLERAVGDWQINRFAWKLRDTIALPEPIPYKGAQGLRNVPEDVRLRLLEVAA